MQKFEHDSASLCKFKSSELATTYWQLRSEGSEIPKPVGVVTAKPTYPDVSLGTPFHFAFMGLGKFLSHFVGLRFRVPPKAGRSECSRFVQEQATKWGAVIGNKSQSRDSITIGGSERVEHYKIKTINLATTYFRRRLSRLLSWALISFTSEFGKGSGRAISV